MALTTVQRGMASHQRKEIVRNKGPFPTRRLMAFLTVAYPTIDEVIRIHGSRKIILMADFALSRRAHKLAGGRPFVATFTCCNGVNPHQRKTGTRMFPHQASRLPSELPVTTFTIHPQRGRMWILVATGATARRISLHRPTVVVATQAGRRRVGTFQSVARLFFMIKMEVIAQFVPPFRDMANTAIAREIGMWNQRAPFIIPILLRHKQLASDQDDPDPANEPH